MRIGLGDSQPASSAGSTPRWMTASPEEMAQFSPQVALAKAWKIPLAPFILNINGTFTDPTVTTLPTSTWSVMGEATRLDQFAVVDGVMFEIDTPNSFNNGTLGKWQNDYYYSLQSGIGARMDVSGAPRYSVSPDFIPLRMLCAMINEGWPMGWVLTNTQSVTMQFNASIPLYTFPTIVNVSFRMWTPYSTTRFVGMTDSEAFCELNKLGIDTSVAQNAPTSRS